MSDQWNDIKNIFSLEDPFDFDGTMRIRTYVKNIKKIVFSPASKILSPHISWSTNNQKIMFIHFQHHPSFPPSQKFFETITKISQREDFVVNNHLILGEHLKNIIGDMQIEIVQTEPSKEFLIHVEREKLACEISGGGAKPTPKM